MSATKHTARKAGWLYFAFLVIGVFNFFYIPDRIYVSGDATSTTRNILESEGLFRLGILSNLIGQIIFLFLGLLLYQLFEEVNKARARVMLVLIVASVPISFLIMLNQVGCLALMKDLNLLAAFDESQRQALSMWLYDLYNDEIKVVGILWGLWLYPLGTLVIRSGFMPRILGVLLIVGCFAYLVDSFSLLLIPEFHHSISNLMALPMAVGEIFMSGWLLFGGIKE